MCCCVWCFAFFFFKQKSAYERRISDWSSDVCSSDLLNQLIAMNASEMVGLDEARKLLDNLKDAAPQLVDGLTPGLLNLTQISALCRALLAEGIPLKD